ncbi:hypothetical protein SpCBS45565_g06507 [Spizellomyces sp. 'palustris']|nr:hypothetical protein SpCBS45565_g06507 [Spizellomyces sp. 'palustris']
MSEEWERLQETLKHRRIPTDSCSFSVPAVPACSSDVETSPLVGRGADPNDSSFQGLNYIAGLDVSFFEGTNEAVACVVVFRVPGLVKVYTKCRRVTLTEPYIPGFLAFRESPILLSLLEELKQEHEEWYPQVVFVDGNGTLHPRQFGLACHVGVLAGVPSIGIAKNFLQIESEGLLLCNMKDTARKSLDGAGKWLRIIGSSGYVFGAALRSSQESINPIFVSSGHMISLSTAVNLVAWCCKYRVPEPIRAADFESREIVRSVERDAGMALRLAG